MSQMLTVDIPSFFQGASVSGPRWLATLQSGVKRDLKSGVIDRSEAQARMQSLAMLKNELRMAYEAGRYRNDRELRRTLLARAWEAMKGRWAHAWRGVAFGIEGNPFGDFRRVASSDVKQVSPTMLVLGPGGLQYEVPSTMTAMQLMQAQQMVQQYGPGV